MTCNQLPPDIGRRIAAHDPRQRQRKGAVARLMSRREAGGRWGGTLVDVIWGASWTLIIVLLMISSGL